MDVSNRTVLVTGGGSGIGLALGTRFLAAGSRVLICGRRSEVLEAAAKSHPGIVTRVADLESPEGRTELARWATAEFPALDVVVQNAGIQRRTEIATDDFAGTRSEIAINLEAPIHLTSLFLPHLLAKPKATLVHVTSGLSFVPLATVPVYSATKAAFHSFTLTLRHQLRKTSVEVVEFAPPAVDTDLGGPGLHKFGTPLDEFADAAFEGLRRGDPLVTYGFSAAGSRASEAERADLFGKLNPPD